MYMGSLRLEIISDQFGEWRVCMCLIMAVSENCLTFGLIIIVVCDGQISGVIVIAVCDRQRMSCEVFCSILQLVVKVETCR